MPAATVADGPVAVHLSHGPDTPSKIDPTADAGAFLASLWTHAFPSPELVDQAAALFPRDSGPLGPDSLLTEGPRPFLRIGPGVVSVRSKDFGRADRRGGANKCDASANEGAIERMALVDLGQRELALVDGELLDQARQAYVPLEQQSRYADLLASYLLNPDDPSQEWGEFPGERQPTRVITEWSRKSRTYMTEVLGLLDYTPMYSDPSRLPGMITLTYPGCWLPVAPSGKAVKKHLKVLRKRYERAYGEVLMAIWKLEFQARYDHETKQVKTCLCEHCEGLDDGRAPHVHMLMVPPHKLINGKHFMTWLRETWADIVAHPDQEHYQRHLGAGTRVDFGEGMRARDPRRVGVYFSKHGLYKAKDYQHNVPQAWQTAETGPGRFWGYWGLKKHTATVPVVTWVADLCGRTMRNWSRAQGVTRQVKRPRVKGGRVIPKYPDTIGLAGAYLVASRGAPKMRKTRTRAVRLKNGRGFISVNSGPEFASQLARFIDLVLDTGVIKPLEPGRLPT